VFLLGRYRQLEEHVRQLDAWSKAQIQAAEGAATRWQDAAAESERKLQEAQQALAAVSRRADSAERDLKRDRETLQVLQDRIVSAFGFGSEAHDALAKIDLSLGKLGSTCARKTTRLAPKAASPWRLYLSAASRLAVRISGLTPSR